MSGNKRPVMLNPKTQELLVKRLAGEMACREFEAHRKEFENFCISTVTMAMCMVLHDKWDFTTEQLNVLLLQITDTYDSVQKNYLTMEDIEQWCKENGIIEML
jgi:hypothetical protein